MVWLESSPKINLVACSNSLETYIMDHPISNPLEVHFQPKSQLAWGIIPTIECIHKTLPCSGINTLLYRVTNTLPHMLANILLTLQRLCWLPKPFTSTQDNEILITLSMHVNKLTPHLSLVQGLILCNLISPKNNMHFKTSSLLILQTPTRRKERSNQKGTWAGGWQLTYVCTPKG